MIDRNSYTSVIASRLRRRGDPSLASRTSGLLRFARNDVILLSLLLLYGSLFPHDSEAKAKVISMPPELPAMSGGPDTKSPPDGEKTEEKTSDNVATHSPDSGDGDVASQMKASMQSDARTAASKPEPLPEGAIGVVAVVNDEVISSVDLSDRIKLILGSTRIEDTPENRKRIVPQAVRILIDEKLQLQEAASLSVIINEDDIKGAIGAIEQKNGKEPGSLEADLEAKGMPKRSLYQQIKAQLAWSKVIAKSIRPKIRISDQEVERARKRGSTGPAREEVQISTILLPVDKPASEPGVKALSEKLIGEIKGGASFEEVSRQFTSGSSGTAAGAFWVEPSQLDPLIAKAVKDVASGEVVGPVRTTAGYQIVKLLDKRTSAGSTGPTTQKQAEIAMKHLTMKLKPDAAQKEAEVMLTIAREVSKNPGTCLSKSIANIENLGDLDIQVEFIRNLLSRLPDALRGIIEPLHVGQVSEPVATPEGIHIYMICERIDLPDVVTAPATEEAPADQIKNQLFAQKIELEAMKYMRNLRRDAFIDIRIGK